MVQGKPGGWEERAGVLPVDRALDRDVRAAQRPRVEAGPSPAAADLPRPGNAGPQEAVHRDRPGIAVEAREGLRPAYVAEVPAGPARQRDDRLLGGIAQK